MRQVRRFHKGAFDKLPPFHSNSICFHYPTTFYVTIELSAVLIFFSLGVGCKLRDEKGLSGLERSFRLPFELTLLGKRINFVSQGKINLQNYDVVHTSLKAVFCPSNDIQDVFNCH